MSLAAANLEHPREIKTASSAERRGSRVLASFLPLAAVLLMVGEVLTPKGLDKPTMTLSAVLQALPIGAAHPSQLYLSNLLVIFGLGALGVSFAAMSTLAEDGNASLATAGAVTGGCAAFCGAIANMLVGFNLAAAATAHTTNDAAARVLLSGDTSAVAKGLLVVYLGGGLVAIVLSALALWRAKSVPRWLPVLFGLGLVLAASSQPGIVAVPLQLPFAASMVFLAACIWQGARGRRVDAATQPVATSTFTG